MNVYIIITLRAKLSGTVYCNQSYLAHGSNFGVISQLGSLPIIHPDPDLWVCVCVWVCYHDNSNL